MTGFAPTWAVMSSVEIFGYNNPVAGRRGLTSSVCPQWAGMKSKILQLDVILRSPLFPVIEGTILKSSLDFKEAIVFCQPFAAAGGPGFQMAAVHGQRKVGQEGIGGLS